MNGYEVTVLAEQWHREAAEDGVNAETWNAAQTWATEDFNLDNGYLL